MPTSPHGDPRKQGGAALLALTLVWAALWLGVLLNALNSEAARREQINADALAEARDALIGYAASYRDSHPDREGNPVQTFGHLPCPDRINTGAADGNCGAAGLPAIGRLPWKTLGLPPLRDAAGECLWYVVAGSAKYNPKAAVLNWDSTGQFIVEDVHGRALAGSTAETRPWAIVIAPGPALAGQHRGGQRGGAECPGSLAASDYLEQLDTHWPPASSLQNISVVLGNGRLRQHIPHNDQGAWIDGHDVFDRIKQRSDFKSDIDGLMDAMAAYLATTTPSQPPKNSTAQKVPDSTIKKFLGTTPSTLTRLATQHWRDHLWYAENTINPSTGTAYSKACQGVLLFGGERTLEQARNTPAERNDPAMYLEYEGSTFLAQAEGRASHTGFDARASSSDILRCITKP